MRRVANDRMFVCLSFKSYDSKGLDFNDVRNCFKPSSRFFRSFGDNYIFGLMFPILRATFRIVLPCMFWVVEPLFRSKSRSVNSG